MDATVKEEQAAEGDIVIALNNTGDICTLTKSSGFPVSAMDIVVKSSLALEKVKEINAAIEKALAADMAQRAKNNRGAESSAQNDR